MLILFGQVGFLLRNVGPGLFDLLFDDHGVVSNFLALLLLCLFLVFVSCDRLVDLRSKIISGKLVTLIWCKLTLALFRRIAAWILSEELIGR